MHAAKEPLEGGIRVNTWTTRASMSVPYLDHTKAGKSPDVYTELMHFELFYPITDRLLSFETRVQMEELWPVRYDPA